MNKVNKHIIIVRSSTPGLSSMGRPSCDMIKALLEQHYATVEVCLVSTVSDLGLVAAKRPDLVVLGVKQVAADSQQLSGEMVWASAYLETQGVNYTGSMAAAIALDFSKPLAKQIVRNAGLNTSDHFMAHENQYGSSLELPLSFPLFIKPPDTGGGKGIGVESVVRDFSGFQQRVAYVARTFQSAALVESYLPGREFSVALLETRINDELIAMPVELIAKQNQHGDRILGQDIKAADTERLIAVPEGMLKRSIVELAIMAFRALGARDYGRIDIRLDAQGTPQFLEANLIPGLAQHEFTSYFTSACWINQAMDYETMILHIVELGISRSEKGDVLTPATVAPHPVICKLFEPVFESI
jgi:D-alanine-D-alanine ligase